MVLTFGESVAQATQGIVCATLAVNDQVNGFLESVADGGSLGFQDATRALRRQFCNNSDDVVPLPPGPGFTGGQCPVTYRVRWRFNSTNIVWGCGSGSQPYVKGPVNLITEFDDNDPQGVAYRLECTNSSGERVELPMASGPASSVSVSITSVERCDGLADNCGDPPNPIPPYVPTTTTVNIEYQNNEEVTINEDVDVTVFAPFVAIGGAIIAPITVSGNTFNLVGEMTLSPEFKVEFKPEFQIGTPAGYPDEDPPNPPGDVPSPPIEGESRRIVGVLVTATSVEDSRVTQILQGENPDIFAPRIGNVSFYVETRGGFAWTGDIPVKNLRQYIPCPVPGGAVDAAGSAEPGFNLDFSPIWNQPSRPAV